MPSFRDSQKWQRIGEYDLSHDQLISVIDDDASIVSAVVGLVRSLGYQASGHASAEAFLASGETLSARCVITDIQMPGMSGIALKQHFAINEVTTPVIMITARTEEALLASARDSGAFCLLGKPFEPDDLIQCLENALASWRDLGPRNVG
jgi:FixJ family two-component response regulator